MYYLVQGSTGVWVIQTIHQAFSYCYMSTFIFALKCFSIVVFVYFRMKYSDYTKSSSPGTEIIAVVDITLWKALTFKVRTVNHWDTHLKHNYNFNRNIHSMVPIFLISRKRYVWPFALCIFILSKKKSHFFILSEKNACFFRCVMEKQMKTKYEKKRQQGSLSYRNHITTQKQNSMFYIKFNYCNIKACWCFVLLYRLHFPPNFPAISVATAAKTDWVRDCWKSKCHVTR